MESSNCAKNETLIKKNVRKSLNFMLIINSQIIAIFE